jgi:hypothetical protein
MDSTKSGRRVQRLPPLDQVLREAGGWGEILRGADVADQRAVLESLITTVRMQRVSWGKYDADISWTALGQELAALTGLLMSPTQPEQQDEEAPAACKRRPKLSPEKRPRSLAASVVAGDWTGRQDAGRDRECRRGGQEGDSSKSGHATRGELVFESVAGSVDGEGKRPGQGTAVETRRRRSECRRSRRSRTFSCSACRIKTARVLRDAKTTLESSFIWRSACRSRTTTASVTTSRHACRSLSAAWRDRRRHLAFAPQWHPPAA